MCAAPTLEFHRSTIGVLLVVVCVLATGGANAAPGAQKPRPTAPGEAAIGGYSPVSYFTENEAQRGSPEHSVRHDGRTYFLTSAEQARRFRRDPERYLPKFAEFCPYNLALGRAMPIDPTNFKILDGQLLLFHQSEQSDGLVQWERSELSEAELMRRAEARFRLMDF